MKKIRVFFKENMLINLFAAFFKLGLFTIGGGMAMVPLLQEKVCDKYGWMTEEEALDCIAVSQGLPGVVAVNMATYVGYAKKGFIGGIVASLGMILPSFIIIILVVCFLEEVQDNPYVIGALTGVKAAATGLIAFAAWKLGRQVLKGWFQWIIAILAFGAIGIFGADAVWVILSGILIGIVYTAIVLKKEKNGGKANEHVD